MKIRKNILIILIFASVSLYCNSTDNNRNWGIKVNLGVDASTVRDKALTPLAYEGVKPLFNLDLMYRNPRIYIPLSIKYREGKHEKDIDNFSKPFINTLVVEGYTGLLTTIGSHESTFTLRAGAIIDTSVIFSEFSSQYFSSKQTGRLRIGLSPAFLINYNQSNKFKLSLFSYMPLINYSVHPSWDNVFNGIENGEAYIISNGEFVSIDKLVKVHINLTSTYYMSPLFSFSSGISFDYYKTMYSSSYNEINLGFTIGLMFKL